MDSFIFTGIPARVVFGSGTIESLAEEADRLGIKRALVLSTPEQADLAEQVAERLGGRAVGRFSGATMHTPVSVTSAALAEAEALGIDGIVSAGGGSTTGLGKALALRTDLPQLVLPTTYAGSEMTSILGETENGRKTTLRSPRVQPEAVIYDIDLTLGLPVEMSVTSGLNAIAHAVEALYARDRNPIVDLMAEEAIRALAEALPRLAASPRDLDMRGRALYGAWLAGVCLGSVGMALHHKLCHTLGGLFDLPHAETHAVILPHAMRFNAASVPHAERRIAGAIGAADAATGLQQLAVRCGAPRSLGEIGMPPSGLEAAVAAAMTDPYWNPTPLSAEGLRALLERALRGGPA